MRSARVVVLSDYIGGDVAASGGAGHAALSSYRALAAAGLDVRVVAGFGGLPDGPNNRTLGGHDLRAGGASDAARAIYNHAAGRALGRLLSANDPERTLVILHQWTRYLSPAALGVIDRYPTMIYMHDYFWACPNGAYYDFRQQQPCDRRPMGSRCLVADCDKQGRVQKFGRLARQATRIALVRGKPERRLFLHLSDEAERAAAPLLRGERHVVVHNPLDIPVDPPARPPPPTRKVGYFGRLEAEKGVADLAEAVRVLGLNGLFVGQGALEGLLSNTPGLDVHQWQPRKTMAAAMRSCAVVVLPSRWHETWGLIVPEAMAAGVPVLVSSRAGSAELVERFGGGATFDPGREGELVAKLATMTGAAPNTTSAHRALRKFLSPERHAARIVALAMQHFALDIAVMPNSVAA